MLEQNQEEAFRTLQTLLKGIAEKEEREFTSRKAVARDGFFGAIPESAASLYIHLSHKISNRHPYIAELQARLGTDNVLVTIAPDRSGQSFYNGSLDKTAKAEKTRRVIEPFEKFSANKSVDAIVYLCDYVCDGYQDPIFPDSVQTEWHIWRPIRLAEELQKPLVVGYQNNFCFRAECYEREFITDREKIKCPVTIARIWPL
ncbi:hypothetical protein J4459_03970 [Candidatus Woesearchaeota archaeon]|nr:hypothetical protein [Candidatus Woesearchaeota archaeon]